MKLALLIVCVLAGHAGAVARYALVIGNDTGDRDEAGLRYAEHPVTIEYTDYSLRKGQRSINSVNIAMDLWLHQMLGGRRR